VPNQITNGNGLRLDQWATRFGLIMAMAGNAVGLGNFLRFPGKAAPFGGAFMVPYFIALVLLGIPLMWIEWTIGRHGGQWGHGSTPGMFHRLWKHPISKYLGIFGVLLPAMIGLYYVYIESWSLGYAWKTLTGEYWGKTSREEMRDVFGAYLGHDNGFLAFGPVSYTFFLITFAVNTLVFSRGIEKGIEVVAKYAMPALVILGAILAVRVLTLDNINGRSVSDGLAQIWVIDWTVLKKPDVWITATGQIFFTLSLGFGMIHTYASYLNRRHDITLNGLAACSTNTFVEVVLGSTIAIPAAVLFFGPVVTQEIVAGGTFDIGFFTLPVIFQQMAGGQFFGVLWFLLLFLAGLTSSVAMFTPLLLFMQDELGMEPRRAVAFVAGSVFLLMQPIILFSHRGLIDELDFWAGTFFLVVFAAIEAVVFAWIFGMKRGWAEMHEGADFQVPRIFYPIMLIVTPVYTIALLGWWTYDFFIAPLLAEDVADVIAPPNHYLWIARAIMIASAIALALGVWHAWRTHPKFFDDTEDAA
jgi:neurotransmitter:Na+ symporter, NSS family